MNADTQLVTLTWASGKTESYRMDERQLSTLLRDWHALLTGGESCDPLYRYDAPLGGGRHARVIFALAALESVLVT